MSSYHDLEEMSAEHDVEDAAARARAQAKGDWCPTCGYSQSEHSKESMNVCVAAYEMDSLFISRAIDAHLAEKKNGG